MTAAPAADTILTADQILAFQRHHAARLFGRDPDRTFKALAKRWHPDVCTDPKASDVFQHIVELHDGLKNGPERITVVGRGGEKELELTPHAETDTGRRWVGWHLWAWSFEKEPALADTFENNLRRLPFADNGMKAEMRTVFPKRMQRVTHDGAPMIVFPRGNDALLVDWIGTHGPFPPLHAAWLGSGLMNIAAYTGWSNWSLPGIALDTVAIDPRTHRVTLPAGWEQAAGVGDRPAVASRRTLGLCPALAARGRPPPPTLTQDVVRQTMREALGDPSGLLLGDKGYPPSIVDWISAPSPADAAKDYADWHRALHAAFGKRRFIKWGLLVPAVYPNL